MKAVMLAAGMGRRLYGEEHREPAKCLLRFAGRTLMARNVEILQSLGVAGLAIVVGYQKEEVLAEARLAAQGDDYVEAIFNPRFMEGPILSLAAAGGAMRCGDDVLFMDADLLYHPSFLKSLLDSSPRNCFLFDNHVDHEVDPVFLCVRGGDVADFGKNIEGDFDAVGEWPGFLKMSPRIAARVADAADALVASGALEVPYEAAFQEVLAGEPPGTFGFEDISGEPWIEIDFPEDLKRAADTILPRIDEIDGGGNRN